MKKLIDLLRKAKKEAHADGGAGDKPPSEPHPGEEAERRFSAAIKADEEARKKAAKKPILDADRILGAAILIGILIAVLLGVGMEWISAAVVVLCITFAGFGTRDAAGAYVFTSMTLAVMFAFISGVAFGVCP